MADTTMPTPAHHNPAVPHHCAKDASIPATDLWRMLQDNHKMVEQLKQNFAQSLAVQQTFGYVYQGQGCIGPYKEKLGQT
mmetsp:Transcript_4896/g.7388  ORF Transcript_4896/g.7388 Transcript_4896/m.7388 type:complete len:80 (+) Transcript_4896:487-726(+)